MHATLTAAAAIALAFPAVGQTVTWDGEGGDLLWLTGDNWDPNGVPPDGANIIIDAGGTVIGPNLPLEVGSLMAMSALEIKGALSVFGPSLITDLDFASCCSQSFVANAPLTLQGNSTFLQRPFFRGGDATTVNGTALFASGLNVADDALRLSGDDITILQSANSDGGGVIDGTVYLNPNAALTSSAAGQWQVKDGGALGLRGTASANDGVNINANLVVDGGEIFADAGRVTVTGSYELKGFSEMDAAAGAELRLEGSPAGSTMGETSFEGAGTIRLNSANITVNGPLANNMRSDRLLGRSGLRISRTITLNDVLVSDGTLTLAGGGVQGTGSLLSRDDTAVLSGFALGTPMVVDGGRVRLFSSMNVNSTLTITGGSVEHETGGALTNNAGTGRVVINGGTLENPIPVGSATFDVFPPIDLMSGTLRSEAGSLRLRGAGSTITGGTIDGGSGGAVQFIAATGSTLTIGTTSAVGDGGTVELGGNGSGIRPTVILTGQLTNEIDSFFSNRGLRIKTSVTGSGSILNQGVCAFEGATADFGATLINTKDLYIDGVRRLQGGITNASTTVQRFGIIFEGGTVVNNNLWSVIAASNNTLGSGASGLIQNNGVYQVGGGTTRIGQTIQPAFNNIGMLVASNADVFVLSPTQLLPDGSLNGGSWITRNSGTIRFSEPITTLRGAGTAVRGDDASFPEVRLDSIEEAALWEVSGDASADDLCLKCGVLAIDDKSILGLDNLEMEMGSSVELKGSATIQAEIKIEIGKPNNPGPPSVIDDVSDVIELSRGPGATPTLRAPQIDLHAVFRPGGDDAGGAFLVDGALTAFPTATWDFDVDPLGAHDVILGSGSFQLAGTLDVSFTQPPTLGDEFAIIAAGDGAALTITGAFDNVRASGIPASLRATPVYGADGVTLSVTCTADTNGDGMLSPADFNGWILAYNNRTPQCDQNGDGACTPADFNGWILNFNTGC